jgi:cytochrome c oxidase subunit 2
MTKQKLFFHFFLIALFTVISGAVYAAQPEAKGINFQDAATPIMHKIHEFHHVMLYIITPITLLVMGLLIYVMIRFRAKANPVPSKTTHHWGLEIAWTLIPTIIVLFIAVKSMQLLYFENKMPEADMTLKVTGYQWYWGYEYPDYGDVNFMAYMIKDNEIDKTKNQVRLLSTDNPVVVPVGKVVRVQVTASDVLHAFAMPAFGIKTDAVPGRLNETWFKVEKEGTYYGQCSEICGTGHAFMPIEIKAVPEAEFEAWIVQKGGTLPSATPVAVEGAAPAVTAPSATTPVAPATDKKDL